MAERNLDFDTVVNRKNTDCLKYDFAVERGYVEENLPGVNMVDIEGTYLVWLDFRGTGIDAEELNRRIIYEAKLWLDDGKIFGHEGAGFQRINIACPRKVLEEALSRIKGILYYDEYFI